MGSRLPALILEATQLCSVSIFFPTSSVKTYLATRNVPQWYDTSLGCTGPEFHPQYLTKS